jgi:error-prone DNA polymerase
MPELPIPPKRVPPLPEHRLAKDGQDVPYAELHCRTNFSFLEGASHADELVARSSELGHFALAVTDRNSVAGIVRAHVAAKEAGLKLLIGAEITPVDASPVLFWAIDRRGYAHLARLITRGRRAAPKGECCCRFDDLADLAGGLLAGVLLSQANTDNLLRYREVFVDRCYAVAELHRGPEDYHCLDRYLLLAEKVGMPLVAANDVHYHVPDRRPLQDVLSAIRLGCTVAELGQHRFANGERHLKSAKEMLKLFSGHPDVVCRTAEVAQRCTFSLDELRYEYPEELCPQGTTAFQYLTDLTWQGAAERYPAGIPPKVHDLLEHELRLIQELRYEAFFLTVWDLVRFARSRDILCQGRGSAANSAVCFCLGVTSVDPERIDILFERFVSKERNEAPDIDVDFEHERREEVLQYLYNKYGRERAGMTAEVITYRPRSAVRDVGKALGLSLDCVDSLAKALEHHNHDLDNLPERFVEAGFDPGSRIAQQLVQLTHQLVGFPRHLSQHVGGMVITQGPLCELVPIENAAMPNRTVVQWDKDDLDALGILKVDVLALGMLTAIRKCLDLIAQWHGTPRLTLAAIPPEDPAVYNMIQKADTMGVFQIESRAQMSMLPRLQPRSYYDLVIEVAIVRPGPIQGDMVHPYLRRRCGVEPVTYPDERIKAVVEKTLGVPLFQEQAMRLAVVAAGFTPGEADQLRRAMGAWRRRGVMEKFRQKLLDGMQANGYSAEFADRLFRQIQGFGDYGFPESHAASFALLVYVSSWLKCYHPAAFAAALINSQPMGFYAPAQLINDARKHGVEALPIDINSSAWDCRLEASAENEKAGAPALRLGFRLIKGFSKTHADRIEAHQSTARFSSFEDFAGRTRLPRPALKQLARASTFASVGLSRRDALWLALPERDVMPLFEAAEDQETSVCLPPMSALHETLADYGTVGLTLRKHPMFFLRSMLNKLNIVQASDLTKVANGSKLKVAGVVLMRQRPSTAKGVTFVTLEDETGMINLVVWQAVWERHRRVAYTSAILVVDGTLQQEAGVIHVIAETLEDISSRLADLMVRSRDFR